MRSCRIGLYLDLPAWGYHVFEMTAAGKPLSRSQISGEREKYKLTLWYGLIAAILSDRPDF